jgi:hypothetical protein
VASSWESVIASVAFHASMTTAASLQIYTAA